eukprot:scaffold4360_cov73-Phaeocystis_antarctica.AAC.4
MGPAASSSNVTLGIAFGKLWRNWAARDPNVVKLVSSTSRWVGSAGGSAADSTAVGSAVGLAAGLATDLVPSGEEGTGATESAAEAVASAVTSNLLSQGHSRLPLETSMPSESRNEYTKSIVALMTSSGCTAKVHMA